LPESLPSRGLTWEEAPIRLETIKETNTKEMKITLVDSNEVCECVGKHIPKPNKLYRIDYSDGYIFMCPTAYANLVALEEQYAKYGGLPPGNVRKHYSQYTMDLYKLLT
jgi:hypothetical protein